MPKIFKQPFFYLILGIIAYIAVFFYLSLYKYNNFLYNMEDLSIFTNTIHNTSLGRWFFFSSHGGYSYLGDHLELALLFVIPFYLIFKSALTLLFIQTLLIGLSAWPLYLIAQKILEKKPQALKNILALVVALSFLLNPFLQNINLEEFHIAPFLIFFFCWTFYFYLQKNYKLFGLFFLLTLITREDASLTLGALSLVALWEYKKDLWPQKKWWLYPMLFSGVWFLLSLFVVGHFNPDSGYRYLLLYNISWNNPLSWLTKFLAWQNLIIPLGFLLPCLFLPLLRPKYLFLALPTFLQVSLISGDNTSLVFYTHYQTFLILPVFLALIESLKTLSDKTKFKHYLWLTIILLIFSPLYISSFMGPLDFLTLKQNYISNLEDKKANQEMLKKITLLSKTKEVKEQNPIALSASYRFAPHLSSRPTAYLNKLTFLGKGHLSTKDFILPPVDYLLIDSADMIEYYLHFINRARFSSQYWDGYKRMNETMKQQGLNPLERTDSLILFGKTTSTALQSWEILPDTPTDINLLNKNFEGIILLGSQKLPLAQTNYWQLNLFFTTQQKITDDYFLSFTSLDKNGQNLWSKIYPPSYGLYPTHAWQPQEIIKLNQWLPIISNASYLKIELLKVQGDIELGPLNDTRLIIDKKTVLGQVIIKN